MIKNFVFLYSTLFLGLVCAAQDQNDAIAGNKADASLLWKISGKNLKTPSYLLGTIHLICRDDYVWTPAMQKALDTSEQVAFELDMDDPSLQTTVSEGLLLKDGKTLEDYFAPEAYAKLSEFLKDSLGIPLEMVQNLKPFAILSLVSMKAVSCTMPDSYEGNITRQAKQSGKEIVGLETAEDQLGIFEKMNKDTTAKQLIDMVDNWDSLKIQYEEMVQNYKKQDLAALYQTIITAPDFKDNLNTLLFDRNEKWIPEIEKLIAKQPVFIAVGAGHLWGDKGVLNLLREQGYTVEAVH